MSRQVVQSTGRRFAESIIDNADDAIVAADPAGVVVTWNAAATRLFGYASAEAIGQPIGMLIPAARRAQEGELFSTVLHGELVKDFETLRRRKNATLVPVSVTVSPIRATDGHLIGTSHIVRDLSAREEADARRGASRTELGERLRALAAGSSFLLTSPRVEDVLAAMLKLAETLMPSDACAVWRLRPEGWRITASHGLSGTFVAQVAAARTGARAPAVPFTDVLLAEDVQGLPMLETRRDAYHQEGIRSLLAVPLTVGSEISGTFVFYYRQRHTFTDVERQTAAAFGNMASAALTTAALYDEQRVRHEQSAFLAEASAVLITSLDYRDTLKRVAALAVPYVADWCAVDLLDDDGSLERVAAIHVDARRRHEAGEGVPDDSDLSAAALLARSVLAASKPSSLSRLGSSAAEPLSDVDRGLTAVMEALALQSYMCVPLLAHHRRPVGVLSLGSRDAVRRFGPMDLQFAQDLAGRAALAIENARASEEARKANQLKDEFLATLSHELRTPLNAIVGYARMLESGVLAPGKHAPALRILNRNAAALTQIVEDVLDISRIVSGKVRLDVQPVDLGTLLTEAVTTMRLAADAKGIGIAVSIDPHAGAIAGDPDRLRQVLWNLLSNAVKFTRRDGRIEAQLSSGESHVDVRVTDTGIGLSSAFLPHVFERFRQADSKFSRSHGGLGLGLAISRHLVEMHGGTISAESAGENQGATFRVSIPIVQQAGRSDAARSDAAPLWDRGGTAFLGERLDGVRVLAVDDEEDALTLLRDILQTAGASVTTVQSPAAAPAVAEAMCPDVFITDIGMKDVDGFALLSQLRHSKVEEVSRVPSIALTAYARSEDRLMALRLGFQRHLAKPIDPDELVSAVRSLAASSTHTT
jgi:PAS domain S-box-containing protein